MNIEMLNVKCTCEHSHFQTKSSVKVVLLCDHSLELLKKKTPRKSLRPLFSLHPLNYYPDFLSVSLQHTRGTILYDFAFSSFYCENIIMT